ncbi:hypothetical protein [Paenibacillus periandrae]|uniref:hypothetical protein n=1 Tax=Paenibacillus periandrae TaxID=1761741 RepID=UPI001F093AFC|nr:hypothetical protein [Paenibacillus periandrae]
MRRQSFLVETENVLNEVSRQFDFVWPSLAGIAFLQKELNNYRNNNPTASEYDCQTIFVQDQALSRISFTNIFPNKSMDDFKEEQAKALLFSLFALYEGWLLHLKNKRLINNQQYKGLQFYDSTGRHRVLISIANSRESILLKEAFYDNLSSNRRYSLNKFNNQLLCYRVFKEIRNCIIHNAGLCSTELYDNINLFSSLITVPTDLNVRQLFNISAMNIGDKINLDLFDVVGLSDIIIKMIWTIDTELSKSFISEQWFISQLISGNSKHYPRNDTIVLKKNLRKTKSFVQSLEFPKLKRWDEIYKRISDTNGRFKKQQELT